MRAWAAALGSIELDERLPGVVAVEDDGVGALDEGAVGVGLAGVARRPRDP